MADLRPLPTDIQQVPHPLLAVSSIRQGQLSWAYPTLHRKAPFKTAQSPSPSREVETSSP